MSNNPKVGVGVIIRNKNKVLLVKRKGSHGQGTWAFTGGHLEYEETPEECAIRETFEEIGIKVKNPSAVAFTNDTFPKEGKHFITIFVVTDYNKDKITIKESDKIEEVGWFKWGKFPSPLFTPVKNLLKKNFDPFST